jgi:hypothetical protein
MREKSYLRIPLPLWGTEPKAVAALFAGGRADPAMFACGPAEGLLGADEKSWVTLVEPNDTTMPGTLL